MPNRVTPVDVVSGRNLLEDIIAVLDRVDEVVHAWARGDVFHRGAQAETLEGAVGAAFAEEAGTTRVIVDMLREATLKADHDGAAVQHITMSLVTMLTRMQLRGQDIDIQGMCNRIRSASTRPSKGDITAVMRTVLNEDNTAIAALDEAITLAGLGGRIFFEATRVPNIEVELRMGYHFSSVRPVMATHRTDVWHAYDARVACIDGFCESAAEMDRLFTAAHESGEPLVVFARKFSDEVLRTIAVNNSRRTFNVIPVVIPYDVDSANVLKDIAVVVGGDVVSSLTGRLINTIDFNELPTTPEVKATSRWVTIVNDGTKDEVDAHLEVLREAIADDELRSPFMLQRARALSSRTVFVRAPDTDMRRAGHIDLGLRAARSVLQGGVIDRGRLHDHMGTEFNAWIDELPSVLPTSAVIHALAAAYANAKLISSTGAVLNPAY